MAPTKIIKIKEYVKESFGTTIVLDKVPTDVYNEIVRHHNFRSDIGDVVLLHALKSTFKGRMILEKRK